MMKVHVLVIAYIRNLEDEQTCCAKEASGKEASIQAPIKDSSAEIIIPPDTAFALITKEHVQLNESVFANIQARFSATSRGIKINTTAIEPSFMVGL